MTTSLLSEWTSARILESLTLQPLFLSPTHPKPKSYKGNPLPSRERVPGKKPRLLEGAWSILSRNLEKLLPISFCTPPTTVASQLGYFLTWA